MISSDTLKENRSVYEHLEDTKIILIIISAISIFGFILRLYSAISTVSPWRDITEYIKLLKQ